MRKTIVITGTAGGLAVLGPSRPSWPSSPRDDLWLATRAQIIDHIQAAKTARDQERT